MLVSRPQRLAAFKAVAVAVRHVVTPRRAARPAPVERRRAVPGTCVSASEAGLRSTKTVVGDVEAAVRVAATVSLRATTTRRIRAASSL